MVNSLQQQPQAASPSVPEPHALTPVAQADPLVRRQRVQDLMAQMQGPYNFIQVGSVQSHTVIEGLSVYVNLILF